MKRTATTTAKHATATHISKTVFELERQIADWQRMLKSRKTEEEKVPIFDIIERLKQQQRQIKSTLKAHNP